MASRVAELIKGRYVTLQKNSNTRVAEMDIVSKDGVRINVLPGQNFTDEEIEKQLEDITGGKRVMSVNTSGMKPEPNKYALKYNYQRIFDYQLIEDNKYRVHHDHSDGANPGPVATVLRSRYKSLVKLYGVAAIANMMITTSTWKREAHVTIIPPFRFTEDEVDAQLQELTGGHRVNCENTNRMRRT